MMEYHQLIDTWLSQGRLTPSLHQQLKGLGESYLQSIPQSSFQLSYGHNILNTFASYLEKQLSAPHRFESFHKKMTSPINYYQFAIDFLAPLIDWSHSLLHLQPLALIQSYLEKKENVVFFANHQIEPDPQVLYLALKPYSKTLSQEMIFVAGDRVTSDPISIPFSLGTNLLCIYSKKYLDIPPEKKREKLLHNKKTLSAMEQLLAEGGRCIYVAPSGGRDRKDSQGKIKIADFDPQSVELFYLISQKAQTPTHFFPLALNTYSLLPPPDSAHTQLGEERKISYSPIGIAIGEEITPTLFQDLLKEDKKTYRQLKALRIQHQVEKAFDTLLTPVKK